MRRDVGELIEVLAAAAQPFLQSGSSNELARAVVFRLWTQEKVGWPTSKSTAVDEAEEAVKHRAAHGFVSCSQVHLCAERMGEAWERWRRS